MQPKDVQLVKMVEVVFPRREHGPTLRLQHTAHLRDDVSLPAHQLKGVDANGSVH